VAVGALLDLLRRGTGSSDLAPYLVVIPIVDRRSVAGDHDPVAFVEIGDLLRQRRQRESIRAEVHLAVTVTDDERRAEASADQQFGVSAEGDRQRERPAQPRQHRAHRFLGRFAGLDLLRHEMRDHLGVGFAFELAPAGFELLPQRAEVFDDAVVHQRDFRGGVRVGIAGRRRTVRRPAGMGDADAAGRRVPLDLEHQVDQLALGAAADQFAVVQRADARAVVAAVFHSPQAIDEPLRDRGLADDADDSAHGSVSFVTNTWGREFPAWPRGNP